MGATKDRMKLNKKDIVIGLIVLGILGAVVFFVSRSNKAPEIGNIATPTISPQKKIENSFNITIPDNVDKADLLDVSGGDQTGIATRDSSNGVFSLTVLADVSDPQAGQFYEAWISKDGQALPLGKLRMAKGGYLLDFSSATDYSSWNKVMVTLEKVNDTTPETHVLEGSF